ncbi:MAG: LysM peptidoglycan-binding domain-containing protein [Verrucomicrobiaceae bacterium]|nr:LysM peptidoglycan-binding domain-containing protein [Verrucomicrobiaceae bacterium]
MGNRISAVEGKLQTTSKRVGNLEGEVQSLKSNLGYPKSSDKLSSPENSNKDNGTTHRVSTGETLSSISRRYQVGVDRLVAENHITNPNTLHPGQEIFIPGHKGTPAAPKAIAVNEPEEKGPVKTHTVRVGDTLSSISRKFGVTSTSIAIANRLLDPNAIRIGQRLEIPVGSPPQSIASQQPPLPKPASTPKPASPPRPEPTEGGEMIAPEGYGFYQIEPGDTLHSIAISFGTNPNQLRILNDFSPTSNSLRIGDYLLVPVPDESLYES